MIEQLPLLAPDTSRNALLGFGAIYLSSLAFAAVRVFFS